VAGAETFIRVGIALRTVNSARLYRAGGFATWEDYCQARGFSRQTGYDLMKTAEVAALVQGLGQSPPTREQARELAPLIDNPPALVAARAEQLSGGVTRVTLNSGEFEWYTPAGIIESVRWAMGSIDCDPASCEEANRTVRAARFYSKDDDGLAPGATWGPTVFLNPPYTNSLMVRFVTRLLDELAAGNVTQAIVLSNSATETRWFQSLAYASAAFCFPSRRVRYLPPGGEPPLGGPLQGQAVFYFGNRADAFRGEFEQYGWTR
jgi:hypothetical protein